MSERTERMLDDIPRPADLRQRRVRRQCCHLQAIWRAVTADTGIAWRGSVCNISTDGLAIVLTHQCRDRLVRVRFQDPTSDRTWARFVRVKYCRSLGDGNWMVGGTFVKRLSQRELDRLLHPDRKSSRHSV